MTTYASPFTTQAVDPLTGKPALLYEGERGATLREYFMAHAPDHPQPWFEPTTSARPQPPTRPAFTPEEEQQLASDADECTDRVREYMASTAAFTGAKHVWEREREKQRWVQWPAAWADEMLKIARPA